MSGSSVPPIVFTDRGFSAPSEADILAGVQLDMNAAFGGDLNPALETPQGQLASSQTAIIGDANAQFLALANGVDPAFASGRLQDAIGRIYFLERTPAEATTVVLTCSGLSGTTIPVGALALAADGNLYACTQSGVISPLGSVSLTFACTVTGPVVCPINTVTAIYQAIPGWDGANNAAPGVTGRDVESRAEFEARRAASVALNSRGSLEAIRGAVLNVPGVLDAYVTENDSASPVTIGSVTLAAKSLYVCVAGGAAEDVAQAIWSKKAPGCGYNGGTTVTVFDDAYSPPIGYPVTFQTAATTAATATVTLADSPSVPANAETLIRAALVPAFAASARIGGTVYASRFYSTVASLGSWVSIISITLNSGLNALPVEIDGIATLASNDVSLVLV